MLLLVPSLVIQSSRHGIYGAPRVFLNLREAGETGSKHRVARLMREAVMFHSANMILDKISTCPRPLTAADYGY
jgi:hypothetical protein